MYTIALMSPIDCSEGISDIIDGEPVRAIPLCIRKPTIYKLKLPPERMEEFRMTDQLMANLEMAIGIATYLNFKEFSIMLKVSKEIRETWNSQAVWKIHYMRATGVREYKTSTDFRGRLKLMRMTPQRDPSHQTRIPQLTEDSDDITAANSIETLETEDLLRQLDLLDNTTGSCIISDNWIENKQHNNLITNSDITKLFQAELKSNCDSNPLQRFCPHEGTLSIASGIDTCMLVKCSHCGVSASMKVKNGKAVITGPDLGPIRSFRKRAKSNDPQHKKQHQKMIQSSVETKPLSATVTSVSNHRKGSLPPLLVKRNSRRNQY